MNDRREIKFRAWDKIKQSMKYPILIEEVNKVCPSTLVDSCGSKSEISDVLMYDYYIPMQYTGLHDKYGKEIYEGDIIQIPERSKFKNGIMKHIFTGAGSTIAFTRDGGTYPWDVRECQVIGNIYENPELLGTAKQEAERNPWSCP